MGPLAKVHDFCPTAARHQCSSGSGRAGYIFRVSDVSESRDSKLINKPSRSGGACRAVSHDTTVSRWLC